MICQLSQQMLFPKHAELFMLKFYVPFQQGLGNWYATSVSGCYIHLSGNQKVHGNAHDGT